MYSVNLLIWKVFCLSLCHCIVDMENERKNQVCLSQDKTSPELEKSPSSVKESGTQGINDKNIHLMFLQLEARLVCNGSRPSLFIGTSFSFFNLHSMDL